MLKITYLEEEIKLEYLSQSVETWKADRILVSLRAAVSTYVETSVASLILPIDAYCLKDLLDLATRESIEIAPCDDEFVEVALLGTWISQTKDSEVGIFVCELGRENEQFLSKLWQESQVSTSVASE